VLALIVLAACTASLQGMACPRLLLIRDHVANTFVIE
jgi:hypothetical protein